MSDVAPDVRDRLNEIFREVFDDDDIQIFDEMTAVDLDDWDSLSHITLVVSVERGFPMLKACPTASCLSSVSKIPSMMSSTKHQALICEPSL